MKYKNIIFDFDGTLVDTAALIVETMRRTIDTLKLPQKTDAECRAMIGYRLEEIPERLWPDIFGIVNEYVKAYREIFNILKNDFEVNLYPNVTATLQRLHSDGVKMAIASSRSKESLEEYTQKLGISNYFQLLIGGDVREGKPSPEPVNKILEAQGWDKNETLVVGDMNVDILMGNRASADTCGVSYGNGTAEELKQAGANYIIPDFARLLEI